MSSSTLVRFVDVVAAPTGRTVHGRIVPYGEIAVVNDGYGEYRERFAPGAFQRSIAERGSKIRLHVQHDRGRLPIGKATRLDERADGLHAEFVVSDTTEGNDALTAIRDGLAESFSVGFRPIRQEQDGDVTVRTEAALREVSLVTEPAYAGASVAGVRSKSTSSVDGVRSRLRLAIATAKAV